MATADLAGNRAPGISRFRQFPVAWRFAVRNQTRNRLAWLLLTAFVPVWYLLLEAMTGHKPLSFRLYATGRFLTVGNPLANKPLLEWFPSFGPTQFAIGVSLAHTTIWPDLATGLAWPAAFTTAGLVIFRARTRNRNHAS
jgi:hypothetical protein